MAQDCVHKRTEHPGRIEQIAIAGTIGGLETHEGYVNPDTVVEKVIARLKAHPELPGVILTLPGALKGMVSRSKCLELLSSPYGNALFLRRSILNLYDELALTPTVLPARMRIDQAVAVALGRPVDQRYEPLLVDFSAGYLRLLDLHVLLLAQSRMLENANRLIQQQVDIERALSSTLELDEVLQLILRHLEDMVPYNRAGVILEQDAVLRFAATRGFADVVAARRFAIPITQSIIYQRICVEQRPLTFSDVTQQVEWEVLPDIPSPRSWLGVPLIHAGCVMGMLSLARTTIQEFIEEEVALAQSFARHAAVALQNARLYAETKAFNQVLEQRVQERTQELQQAYDKLERMDRAKSDFIAVTSHELRTPLTVINCYIQMLRPHLHDVETLAHMAEGLDKGVQRMHEVVNSMLDVAKVDHEIVSLYYAPTDLAHLLNVLSAGLQTVLTERRLTLQMHHLAALLSIRADGDMLHKVFYHLLTNAIKYTPDGGTITISGQHWPADESPLGVASVQITIADTGIGIDPAYHELIFTKFYRLGEVALHSSSRTNFKGGGPGLGLAIVRGVVEAHRGQVWVESPGCDEETLPGSQFHVLLPVEQLPDTAS
ncbi:MAG TPA: ATP-binding protein [Anaerolineae bacterium]|nr:ATP-binding protein [Anaerolineae bacterium]